MNEVIKLLQDMLEKSKEDGKSDGELFGKFKCYCDSTNAEKASSIADTTKEIGNLEGKIEELSATSGKLSVEAATLNRKMTDNERARNDATALREKAHEDFVSEEEDMNGAMAQMQVAIDTLSDISYPEEEGDAALLAKASGKTFRGVKLHSHGASMPLSAKQKSALKAAAIFLKPADQKVVSNFLQVSENAQVSTGGEIVGILKQMKDTFEENLRNAQAGEAAAVKQQQRRRQQRQR